MYGRHRDARDASATRLVKISTARSREYILIISNTLKFIAGRPVSSRSASRAQSAPKRAEFQPVDPGGSLGSRSFARIITRTCLRFAAVLFPARCRVFRSYRSPTKIRRKKSRWMFGWLKEPRPATTNRANEWKFRALPGSLSSTRNFG